MSKDIKRAEKRGAKQWAARYRSTYEAVMADKEAERDKAREEAAWYKSELDSLRKRETGAGPEGCSLPCFRLQQEQVVVSSLEHDVRAAEKRAKEFHAGWLDAIVRAGDAEQEAKRLRTETVCAVPCYQADKLKGDVEGLTRDVDIYRTRMEAVATERDEGIALGDRLSNSLADVMAERDQLRALNADLHAENVKALGEIARLRTEVEDLGRRYTAAENDLNRVFEACGLTSGDVGRLVERVKDLRSENAAQMEKLIAYSYASAFTAEALADAKLGRLIRAMPVYFSLSLKEDRSWGCFNGKVEHIEFDSPEEALAAAGVTESQYPNAEPSGCRADTARLDWLQSGRASIVWYGQGNWEWWQVNGGAEADTLREAIDRARQAAGTGAQEEGAAS